MSAIEESKARSKRTEAVHIGPERPRIEAICLVFISLVAAVFLLRYAQAILLPFVLSLLLFYTLDPVVSWISHLGIARIVSCLLLMAAFLGTGTSAVYLLRGQASAMVDRLPEAMRKAQAAIESHRGGEPGTVAKVQKAAGELKETASEAAGSQPDASITRVQIEKPIFNASEYLWSGSVGVMGFVGQAITVVFLVFFLLASGDLYKRKLVEVVGPRLSRQRLTIQILDDIDRQIGRFLLVQVLASIFVGAGVAVSLWLLGLNQAAMWGVSAGVLNSIPYFGAIVVTVAVALAAFLQFGTLGMVAATAGITLFVTSIDGLLVKPFLTGRFSKLSNLAVFVSLLFWGWLWGALGMLLAVPIMMTVKSICDHIEGLQPIGHLLGEGK